MDSPPERPSSALARGVKITEFKGSRVNPEPVTIEESEILLEDYLSPRKLVSVRVLEEYCSAQKLVSVVG